MKAILRYNFVWVSCITTLGFAVVLASGFGPAPFDLRDLFTAVASLIMQRELSDATQHDTILNILFNVRLPRLATAALAGAALAAAGVLSQGLFRNALASPSILGTTAGGSALAAIAFYLGAHHISWFFIPAAGFIGALLATGLLLVLLLRFPHWSVETLLLVGLALNTLFGAITTFALSLILADHLSPPIILHWLMGSIQPHNWYVIGGSSILVFLGIILASSQCTKLDVLVLGEQVAKSLSVDIAALRLTCVLAIALLVGSAVAIAGPLPFIGLMVPHISRLMLGAKHRGLLMLSVINGMSLVLLADWLTRQLSYPRDLQTGIFIAFIGAPFFLLLLLRNFQSKGQGHD